jgi:hypothetical protein
MVGSQGRFGRFLVETISLSPAGTRTPYHPARSLVTITATLGTRSYGYARPNVMHQNSSARLVNRQPVVQPRNWYIIPSGSKKFLSVIQCFYPVTRGESFAVCKVALAAYPVLRIGIFRAFVRYPGGFMAWYFIKHKLGL